MRADRGHAATRAALLVTALLAGAAVWWSSSAAPPPLPAESHWPNAAASALEPAPATAGAGGPSLAVGDAAAVASEPVERVEVAAAPGDGASLRTAVVGKVLDASGAPLVGFTVLLQRTGRPPPPQRAGAEPDFRASLGPSYQTTFVCCTDDAGAFAFEPLVNGGYRCHVVGLETAVERFDLATGEVRELTLKSPLVALSGTLFRNGTVAKDCFVAFDDGRTRRAAPLPDERGVIRSFAAPGRLQVYVHVARGVHQGPGWGPCLSKHVLIVPDGVPAMSWRLETGGTEIVFAVTDRDGAAIDTFAVEVEGTGACDNESGRYVVTGAPGRSATIAALPAGRWRVAVTGDDFRTELRELSTGISGPREVVALVALRAAPVRVILRPRTQFFAIPAADEMPALHAGDVRVPCNTAGARAVTAAAPAFDYRAVPLGKAKLCFDDRVDGGELVPLPFEPIAPVIFDVVQGYTNEVAVDVEPRPFADLRVADDKGREVPGATLTVWAGGRLVRNRDGLTSQRWAGPLPLGDYRVVVECKGARREHALRADRAHVRERYRP